MLIVRPLEIGSGDRLDRGLWIRLKSRGIKPQTGEIRNQTPNTFEFGKFGKFGKLLSEVRRIAVRGSWFVVRCLSVSRVTFPVSLLPPQNPKPKIQNGKGSLFSEPFGFGGDEEDRTPGLGIANAALSQLSYIPGNFRY